MGRTAHPAGGPFRSRYPVPERALTPSGLAPFDPVPERVTLSPRVPDLF